MPKKNPIIDSGYEKEIRDILRKVINRDIRTGKRLTYQEAREIIREKYGLDISVRALKYYTYKYLMAENQLPTSEVLRELNRRGHLVNVIEKRIWALKVQEERIKIDFGVEKKMKKLLKSTGKEIEIYNHILSSLLNDYISLGVVQKVPDKVEITKTEDEEQLPPIEALIRYFKEGENNNEKNKGNNNR